MTRASLNSQRQDGVNRNSPKKKNQRKLVRASEVIELDDGSDIEIQNSNQIKLAPILARQEAPPKPATSDAPQISCPVCMESLGDLKEANRKVSTFIDDLSITHNVTLFFHLDLSFDVIFQILTTPCGHLFCDVCLKASLQAQQNKCPQCRNKVIFAKCIALFI